MTQGVMLVIIIGTLILAISLGYSYGFEKGVDKGIRDVIGVMPYEYAAALADAEDGKERVDETENTIRDKSVW